MIFSSQVIMERHKALIPRIQETLVKTECYWKCYSYGDDLLPVFDFIDVNKNSSVKEVTTVVTLPYNESIRI